MNNIFIYSNSDISSYNIKNELNNLLISKGINVVDSFNDKVELIISIGGDGTFLSAVKDSNFSNVPILGINTGHLGFFAEYNPDELNDVCNLCLNDDYIVQKYKTIKTYVNTSKDKLVLDPAVNDVFVKHKNSVVHLDLYIGDELVENFSGDGILVSSSAGSTAYNYSLGGSIVDPNVDLLQITPVAGSNNAVYRSLTSSIVVSSEKGITIKPKDENSTIVVIDGIEYIIDEIKDINISLSDKEINVVRRKNYSFFSKVRTKFL